MATACVCAIALGVQGDAVARDYFVNPSGADGSFRTVQSAVDAVVGQSETDRANIFIAPAKYVEFVTVEKPFVTFIGQGETASGVTISFNKTKLYSPVYDLGATVTVTASAIAFMARNLTFENSTPEQSSSQALALGCFADRAIFDNVRALGYQDTVLVDGRARQYFRDSFIAGDTDFIFGDATAVFERCTLQSRTDGYITAADTPRDIANGLIFLDCTLVKAGATPNNSTFLGRPWFWAPSQQMPSVIYIRTRMGTHIARVGWDSWDYLLDPSTNRDPYTRVSEWGSMNLAGQLLPDSNQDGTPDGRVRWADPMTAEQAGNYTLKNIFGPVEFWNATTQPETSGTPYVSQGAPWNAETQLLSLPSTPGARRQLLNISTRLRVGAGQPVGIGGFIVTGSAPKKVIVRAIGPSLRDSGLTEVLTDPVVELHGGAQDKLIATNDNWKDDPVTAAELAASGMTPRDERESATVLTLQPGHYTAVIGVKNSSAGMALIEVYDCDPAAESQLGNVSTLGSVGTGDDVLIGGLVVAGPASAKVVVRALGPSLISFGVEHAIDDPTLAVHDSNGNVTSNDDWQTAASTESIPVPLQPQDSREPAIHLILAPGNYTAIVRGKGNTTGVALIEAYNLQ